MLEPDLGGYLMPDDGHELDVGASIQFLISVWLVCHLNSPIGTKTPSTTDPFKLKYQDIALRVVPLQVKAGVTPEALLKAETSVERVNVFDVLGRMPPLANQS